MPAAVVDELQIHEICKLFPRVDPEASEAFRQSIRVRGVRRPGVMFEGKLLDGRNRYLEVKKLNEEGATLNGQPYEFPTVEFEGTTLEALDFVMDENFQRRHLTSGQKAAIAVNAMELGRKYQRAAGIRTSEETEDSETPSLVQDDVVPKEDRDFAQYVANRAGSNRQFVSQAMTIKREDPRLLKDVIEGKVKIGKAFKIAKGEATLESVNGTSRKVGRPKKEEEPKPENAPDVFDGRGEKVKDESNRKYFEFKEEFKEALSLATQLKAACKVIAESPAGAWLEIDSVCESINNVRKNLRDSEPWTVCEDCGGERRGCKTCTKAGFLSRAAYKRAHGESDTSTGE